MNPELLIRKAAPVTDEEAAAMVRPQTRADLADRIMATTAEDITAEDTFAEAPRKVSPRRRLLYGVAVVGVTAAAAVVVTSSATPGQRVGPVQVGPPSAQAAALSFSREGDYLIVKVKDPVADPARYRREFAARGLNVDLTLAPSSPKRAGSVLFLEDDGDVQVITAEGACGPETCGVGVKIPSSYTGHVNVVFGRTARPGEQYDTAPGDTPGEGVGLSDVKGRTVADVLAEAARRHITRIEYRYEEDGSDQPYPNGVPADKVDKNWYVHDALAGSEGQVIIFVGPEPTG
ncbi:hypothetical protein GCM10023194_01840 [Planotetraspora phitsanulokensis]|uniref:Uncharacterized protein n=1 Tax=Planotetraspora phitsanulokensis TaxID=575192 RepID=A0A8J3U8Q8_9ACTN|nr:hypothetical protein [Planotetraspora phitsanulokensis]GII40217.1 hypothetical protein Pph01_52200 [Planotetraspora phitsanulokensis]